MADSVEPDMLEGMAAQPILLLQANPNPEIKYELAVTTRPDAIIATGRSDYPNQVNNVLGFPFVFRGALDVRSKTVNEEMKKAATYALAALAREVVPEFVLRAYGLDQLRFGPDYVVPKPNDYRALEWVASAVAQAAMKSGVARKTVDIAEYRERLRGIQQPGRRVIHSIVEKARRDPKRLVFSEGEHPTMIRAARLFQHEGFGTPILVGREEVIQASIAGLGLNFAPEIVDPLESSRTAAYARQIFEARQRKGVTLHKSLDLARDPTVFGLMMVREGEADVFVSGLTHEYPEVLRPILQHIALRPGLSVAAGVFRHKRRACSLLRR